MSGPLIVVIGGGAAGFFGAINAALTFPAARVVLLEGTRRPLTKVRVSGGGRCNVTHNCFDPVELVKNYPRGAKELRSAFTRFQPADTVKWFEQRGVALKAEADGRMFPTTDDSATIAQCLLDAASKAGVDLRLGAIVSDVARLPEGDARGRLCVTLRGGEELYAHSLLLATGSMPGGYEIARSLGHTIEPLVPSLFTFNVEDPRLADLAGVAFPQASLALVADGQDATLKRTGPMLITHWGLSGPAVLKLSAFGAAPLFASKYQAKLTIRFLPDTSEDEVKAAFRAEKDAHGRRSIAAHPLLDVPRRFWQRLVQTCGLDEQTTWADAGKKPLERLAAELTRGEYRVVGKGVFKEEFVTAGGVRLKEVDFRTMESRVCPGLYLAGEVLDVDGITGGFNFQNAWTTSWLAAQAMGR